MINLKKALPVMAFLLMFTASASLAQAQPKGGAPEPPAQMSQEDRAAIDSMWQAHRQKMDPLKDQMWAKKMEYEALLANPNTKPNETKAVIDDMLKVRKDMRALRDDFAAQMKSKGYDFGPGFHGHKYGGPGCGFGPDFDDRPGPKKGKHGKGPGRHHDGGPRQR